MFAQLETKMEFPSLVENINIAEHLIDDIKDQYTLSEDVYGNMLVAITEAVNNAIRHGNKLDPKKNVGIQCEYKEGKIVFVITDEGEGFNFYQLPDPTAPENLEKPNGRGIFLMKHLADQIVFSDNGRSVELCFKIADTPAES